MSDSEEHTFMSPVGIYGSFLSVDDVDDGGRDYKFMSDKDIESALGITGYDKWCFEMGRVSLSESRSMRDAKKKSNLAVK